MSDAAAPVVDDDADGPFADAPPQIGAAGKATRAKKATKRLSRPELRARREAREAAAAAAAESSTAGAGAAGTSERRPAVGRSSSRRSGTPKRESLADGAAFIYGSVFGQLLAATPSPLAPAGRAMQLNAPVVGAALDDLVEGTFIDRKLQPVAQRGDKLKALADAATLPLLALLLGTRPEMYPTLAPVLRATLESNIVALGPQLVKKKKRDNEVAKVMKDLADEGMLPINEAGEPPTIDDLVYLIFGPPPAAEAPQPDEA